MSHIILILILVKDDVKLSTIFLLPKKGNMGTNSHSDKSATVAFFGSGYSGLKYIL